MGENIVELVEAMKDKFQTIAVDGKDDTWTIYVDPLDNGQYLVTFLDRDDMREQFALADNIKDLTEALDEIIYHNELV